MSHFEPSPQHHALCVSIRTKGSGLNTFDRTQVILPSNIPVKHGIYLKAYTIKGLLVTGVPPDTIPANNVSLWNIKITPSDATSIGNHMMRNTNATDKVNSTTTNENYSNTYPIPLFNENFGHRDYSPPCLIAQFTSNNFNRFALEVFDENMAAIVSANSNYIKLDLWLIID